MPAGHEELGEYLQLLKEALIAAKVSRAHLAHFFGALERGRALQQCAAGIWRTGRFLTARVVPESKDANNLGLAYALHKGFHMKLDQTGLQLGNFMSYLSQRQEVIASNIANADTPGYQTRDVEMPVDFSAAVRERQRPDR